MKIERLEHSRVKASFEVTVEEFKVALDKAFEVCNAKVTIKGFRAGKAPRSVYEKNYGVHSLYDEALNYVLNSKAAEVYADKELAQTIVGPFEPSIEGENVKFEEGFVVALTFDVEPTVSLPQYKGLEYKPGKTNATKKDIDTAINEILKKDAEMAIKEEQVIEKMDFATFDFVGSVDGVEFPGGKAENYELQIGSGQFIPGFEDQMIGMTAGETKDLNVKFPKNYGQKDLAGKAAVFKVTVHEVKVEKLPELTDEYVANLNLEGITTVKDLKASKKDEIEARKTKEEADRKVDTLVNTILDNAVVDMPQSLINERVNQIRAQYENQAKMYNIPLDTFLQLMGTTKEAFEEQTLEQGKRQALFNVVASEIIKVENLAPTKEQIEEVAKRDAEAQGKSVEEVYSANLSRYYSNLAYEALVKLLVESAVVAE